MGNQVRGALLALGAVVLALPFVIPLTAAGPASAATLNIAAATVSTPNKLVIVYMENHGLADITSPAGVAAMPYLNSLWDDPSSEQFTDYHAVAHPSFPNYSAMASGETSQLNDQVTPGEFNVPTIWDQLSTAGDSWGVYDGSEPVNCSPAAYVNDTKGADTGPYKIGHNNAVPFAGVYTNSSECENNQPLQDMSAASLPDVSFVAPNLCDDMHGVTSSQAATNGYANCVTGTTPIETRGDSWLAANVPEWTAAGADVLITFDEGDGNSNQVYAVLTGPGVTSGNNSTPHTHYSILAGLEDAYGLPLLGNAASASPIVFPGTASTTSPSVTITLPAPSSTVSGTVTVSGTAAETGGSISQVQVSVNGGTPVTATGTTSWSTSMNTTALTNGAHTITATATDASGNTGTASENVTVQNAVATSCPAPPSGYSELSGNVSVESSQTGWTGVYNKDTAVTRVEPVGGSYDGAWALQVAPKSGDTGAAGLSNASPFWETDTTVGQTFKGSVFVKASVPGEKVTLVLREENSVGATVSSHATTMTLSDTNWHQITSAYIAQASGDSIRYFVYASNFASSSQNFLADCLSLQMP